MGKTTSAKRVSSIFGKVKHPPGSFDFSLGGDMRRGFHGLLFVCPCGCGDIGHLPLRIPPVVVAQQPSWDWDGNEEQPTLTPSIRKLDGCKWHGYLTRGVWREG